jgi:hypothetical protein
MSNNCTVRTKINKTADAGSATFNTEEKATLLMRNIRRHIVKSEAVLIGQDNNST